MASFEFLLILLVALLVLGPKQIPQVAKHLGLLYGRLQRWSETAKSSFDDQLKLATLQDNLAEAEAAEKRATPQNLPDAKAHDSVEADTQ